MTTSKTLINDRILPDDEALLQVQERGFRFGDGVFETILVHEGMPYLWRYHLERLKGGLAALRIEYDTSTLLALAIGLLKENGMQEGLLRLSVTRGIGSRGYLPVDAKPTLVMETLPPAPKPAQALTLWLSGVEKIAPRALPTHCKLAQGVNATLARMEAADHGCDDALQLSAGGHIAEASSANLFWLKDDVLYTPLLSTGALGGVTRRRVMELSPWRVVEGEYGLDALKAAQSVATTNAAYGIAAVNALLPAGGGWRSEALAQRLNHLRDNDITGDTGALRESLART